MCVYKFVCMYVCICMSMRMHSSIYCVCLAHVCFPLSILRRMRMHMRTCIACIVCVCCVAVLGFMCICMHVYMCVLYMFVFKSTYLSRIRCVRVLCACVYCVAVLGYMLHHGAFASCWTGCMTDIKCLLLLQVRACMCVCTRMYACMYTYAHVYADVELVLWEVSRYVCEHVCICSYMYVYIYIMLLVVYIQYVCMYAHVCKCICQILSAYQLYRYTSVCILINLYAYVCLCMYVCMYVYVVYEFDI